MFGLFIVFKNAPVNCHSTLIWQYLSRACPKTICSAHFVASLCRTLCRTVRFLAIFDKVRRQSAPTKWFDKGPAGLSWDKLHLSVVQLRRAASLEPHQSDGSTTDSRRCNF